MKVFISNQLPLLADALYKKLFQRASPFEKRWVIIPTEEAKLDLYFRWLTYTDIIAGIQMLTYGELVRKILPEVPSKMELSLRIASTGEPHAEELSSLFLNYLKNPGLEMWLEKEGWQQTVWKKVFGTKLPTETLHLLPGPLFFYNPQQIAPYELAAFSRMDTSWFIFSPSEMYLGDFHTEREQLYLLRKTKGAEREELASYFKEDSPLLSNWSSSRKNLLQLFEETDELFVPPQGNSALHSLQNEWLTLGLQKTPPDLSIQLHSAPTLLREVEVVWEILQTLPHTPREIVVFAPSIQPYAAFIEWVFTKKGGAFDYSLSGLEAKTHSPTLQALELLLTLPKMRFSRECFEKLVLSLPFLKKFNLSLEDGTVLITWMKEAHLRYDMEGWHTSLKRALETLATSNPSDLSLDFTDVPLLNRWIDITLKLEETFSSMEDRSASHWADWIEKLIDTFLISGEEPALRSFLRTLRCERISGIFPYSTIEKLLLSSLTNTTGSTHRSNLESVRFTSLTRGAIPSAKTIIVMGLQEGAFPRTESASSLPELPTLNRAEEDRFLFLEVLAHAEKEVILTYTRCHPEDGKEIHPSSLVEELKKDRGGLTTLHHPNRSYPAYPTACNPVYPVSSSLPKKTIDIRLLKKLARHPVQFFLESSVGLRFPWDETESEFLFSPLEMSKIRTASLHAPQEKLILDLERQGKLPLGPFRNVALQAIDKELTYYHEALKKLGIDPHTISNVDLPPTHLIQGTLENVTEHGLIYHGDGSFEDLLKMWPLLCVAQTLYGEKCSTLFFTKKAVSQEILIKNPQEALSRYLAYLEKSLSSPSPLLPAWGHRIFKGKTLPEKSDDPIIAWAEQRNLLPPSDPWLKEWRPFLQEVFHELL